mmetsp:Transcript_19175/g.28286  ORF Transcript_19175/g.28286 Transcript_19175/m.28286 type:complete len:337 (-) Transcript_19175:59-1069(-)|eukprot:CAMPEP_0171462946 /NCGR_PEP_ID=MMETSP0945-20130129/6792_1 /TAXON_ID=109269 /ORGANISM="Vaucheria litorea, Strain CCMP2940" /LENGTH=336 /DNA_ID=CAMNT_0011989597 /DNA_START=285 /DNA_END=1295 /DNA_ORIENTATION=-
MRAAVLVAGVLAASVGSVLGECNNACSGHGRCGNDDICACYPMWGGSDCSERKCPWRKAWADVKDTSVTGREEHYYAECAGRGRCDKELGQCVCDPGFEGEGCERMQCPNKCNGHGSCELMSSVNSGYSGWDKDKIQVCVCDPGFEGHDCLDRKCKLGDDPISRFDSGNTPEADEVQTVTITSSTFGATDQFLLEYEDWRGNTWLTRPIPTEGLTAIAIKEALQSLPQRSIDTVSVEVTTNSGTVKEFVVTFDSPETPGNQPLLVVHTAGCTENGCQPVYNGITGVDASNTGVAETDGTGERLVCSNRGKCDPELGECRCHKGFYGHACEKQTLVL